MEFLRNNMRFSFNYGGKSFLTTDYTVESKEEGNTLTTTYKLKDGLVLTNVAKKHEKFNTYEWVNYFKNTSDKPTEIISDLWDCDCELEFDYAEEYKWNAILDDPETTTQVHVPTGTTQNYFEFYCDMNSYTTFRFDNVIFAGENRDYCATEGISSSGRAPFFNVHYCGKGFMAGIGWSGQWKANVERKSNSVVFKSKIEDTNFKLLPGEEFRTSSVVIMPYEANLDESFNLWRRFIKECIAPIKSYAEAPYCAEVWGGMSSKGVIERIETLERNKIPYEYIWMDAGWNGKSTKISHDAFEGDWSHQLGDWSINKFHHPNELLDVAETIKKANKKFLLWFEPERARTIAPIITEHPEYLFFREPHHVVNLGNPDALEWCYNTISSIIEKLDIKCYRQDYNEPSLELWREIDTEDRKGITEIKHINGLYKLWDMLLERFPGLLIDNCAGGGRRIDMETLKRSITLWRSDMQCPKNHQPEITQNHTLTFSRYMPYSGTGLRDEKDVYRWRSAYAPALVTGMSCSERDPFDEESRDMDMYRKYSEEYLKVRPYTSCDFYPLTVPSSSYDVWCAWQYNRPEEKDGVVQIFRRPKAPYTKSSYKLSGLKADKNYSFVDADTNEEIILSGEKLMSSGFEVEIPEVRTAKLYFYKEI